MATPQEYYAKRYGGKSQQGATDYYGRPRATRPTVSDAYERSRGDTLASASAAQANKYINSYMPQPVDPGLSAMDMFQSMMTYGQQPGSGGSGRGGGGGGGGGAAGVDPAVADAMNRYALSIRNQANPYAGYGDRLKSMYDTGVVDQRYGQYQGDINQAMADALSRVGGIGDKMQARIGETRSNVGAGFSARQAALSQLADAMGAGQRADVSGMNQILSSADAGSVTAEEAPLANLLTAGRETMGNAGTLFDQAIADRAAIAGDMISDVQSGLTRDQSGLLANAARQRLQETSALDRQRQQLDADLWLKSQDWQTQQNNSMNQLLLQMAQMGIDISGLLGPAGINGPATVGAQAVRG